MKESNYLRCDFTEQQLKEFSGELARATASLARAEEEKKRAMAAFADRVTAQKVLMSTLAQNINEGYEMRSVDCAVELNTPVTGTARIIRMDTAEIVRDRAMTGDEMQYELKLQPEPGSFAEKVMDKMAEELANPESGTVKEFGEFIPEGSSVTIVSGDHGPVRIDGKKKL